MAGTLRLSNTGTGNGQSTITTAASGDTTYTLPSGGGTFVTTASTEALYVPFASGNAVNPSIHFLGDDNTGIYTPGGDQIAIATAATTALTIDALQRVGIGTSSPGSLFHLNSGASDLFVRMEARGANALESSFLFLTKNSAGTNTGGSIGHDGNTNTLYLTGDTSGGATQHVSITSAGNLGIGTTSPQQKQHIHENSTAASLTQYTNSVTGSTSADGFLVGLDSTEDGLLWVREAQNLTFGTNNTERARIDSSGRLLVGTSSTSDNSLVQIQGRSGLSTGPAEFALRKGALPASGENITVIKAQDNSGNTGAFIAATADANWSSGTSHPTRLTFATTATGASSPTERLRIDSNGLAKFTQSGSYNDAGGSGTSHYFQNNLTSSSVLVLTAYTNSYANIIQHNTCLRAANSAYSFFKGVSGNGSTSFADNEFDLRGDGNAFADGTWSGGGADYAEYFEWSDSNPDVEDRRGISVVLDGDKIREAQPGEDPIGVISGNPSVVGDAAWNKWSGKYLRDEFGTYIQENYEATDEDGSTVIQQRRKLNPAYDPDVEYISREQRPEWDCVGLMGKLRIRKGQVTGSRWIKMRDISDSVEEWLVR